MQKNKRGAYSIGGRGKDWGNPGFKRVVFSLFVWDIGYPEISNITIIIHMESKNIIIFLQNQGEAT